MPSATEKALAVPRGMIPMGTPVEGADGMEYRTQGVEAAEQGGGKKRI
jgi:hypothetical protein